MCQNIHDMKLTTIDVDIPEKTSNFPYIYKPQEVHTDTNYRLFRKEESNII